MMSPEPPSRAEQHLLLAGAYAKAAGRVLAQEIAGIDLLPYFAIVAHGLELGLKAILIGDGRDEEYLMLVGHDLAGCRDAVERGQLDLSDAVGIDFAAMIDALTFAHATQCFRYPQRYSRDLPDAALALDCLRRLLKAANRRLRSDNPLPRR